MIELSHRVKPTKKKAFEILINLKSSGFNELHPEDLDSLINYFAPPIPKIATTAEQWVCKAIDINETRRYLTYMFVENGIAYGSDGTRIHWCNTVLANGFYDPKTLLKIHYTDHKYPDMNRIISLDFKDAEFDFSFDKAKTTIINKYECFLLSDEQVKIAVNYRNLFCAANGLKNIVFKVSASDYIYSNSNPFGEFIIMPIRQ